MWKRECKNNRINSDTLIHCDSTLVRQDLCVDAIVGGEETEQPTVLQTDTVIFAAPADPITPPLRLTDSHCPKPITERCQCTNF